MGGAKISIHVCDLDCCNGEAGGDSNHMGKWAGLTFVQMILSVARVRWAEVAITWESGRG